MAETDVAPATDKESTSLFENGQNPNAGTSHLTQGPNTDETQQDVPPETESESIAPGEPSTGTYRRL